MTPNVIASPIAIKTSTEPTLNPKKSVWIPSAASDTDRSI
jgi:hypothetical protein